LGLICLVTGKFLFAFLFLIISILGFVTGRKRVVYFSTSQIIYPSFINKDYTWGEVANLVLKDGVLTIDLKNNTLLQSNIAVDESIVNEKEFNQFCQQGQIKKLNDLKSRRDNKKVSACLEQLTVAAKGTDNLMPYVLEAVENDCTLGEISDTLRNVFGEYK
jgi:hypothetical protein